ncbi:4-methyl-5(b-hydroxyethyl)-thiazole monophosphate biosynthesis [Elusimicrobium posterum]|uniref:DJ-1 family glyoxalase III n=1 Tax=Elusimicrobium posterum TaxID=3116653 RepID=UPI003C73F25D
MSKAALFLIDGFEETEAVVTIDLLRRAGVEVSVVSLTGKITVPGKHAISINADILFDEIKDKTFDMLIIPGGTINYMDHEGLVELVKKQHNAGQKLAAICAAPAVFGKAGILDGYKAVIFPGMTEYLGKGAVYTETNVITDRNITTGRGPAAAMLFGAELIGILEGKEVMEQVKKKFLLD